MDKIEEAQPHIWRWLIYLPLGLNLFTIMGRGVLMWLTDMKYGDWVVVAMITMIGVSIGMLFRPIKLWLKIATVGSMLASLLVGWTIG